jgi:hypothetical protein
MRIAIALIATVLAACSTPYQEMGFTGGVSAQQMTSETFRISARGNGYTDATSVQDFLMLKAAETTTQNGGTHFVVVSAADASRTAEIVTGGTARTSFVGNTATTSYTPPTVHNVFKPGQDAYIRVLKIGPGQQPPPNAISAAEIIQFVGPRVKRSA